MDKTLKEVQELLTLACDKLKQDSSKKHSKLIWLLEDALNFYYDDKELSAKDELFLSDSLVNLLDDEEEKTANS